MTKKIYKEWRWGKRKEVEQVAEGDKETKSLLCISRLGHDKVRETNL
jgi:hypothetical protein